MQTGQEVGNPNFTALYQFIDPLRGKVDKEDRVDLNNPPKHNGTCTFVHIPKAWPIIVGFEEYRAFDDELHGEFHAWIQERGLWTLLYSPDTFAALIDLEEREGVKLILEIAMELFPNEENRFLGRAHGRPGTYTAGCRGPMCRAANTAAQRKRYLGTVTVDRQIFENLVFQIRDSYEAYITYIKWIMTCRRGIKNGGEKVNKHWQGLNLQDTILIDCTDESHLL